MVPMLRAPFKKDNLWLRSFREFISSSLFGLHLEVAPRLCSFRAFISSSLLGLHLEVAPLLRAPFKNDILWLRSSVQFKTDAYYSRGVILL